MKDSQIPGSGGEPRIFFLSPVLHCVSMTALVYLRSSFGFAYLRPKSVFFAFSWAFCLYAIYAVMVGTVWRAHWPALIFGVGVMLLYWTHLWIAFRREWRLAGEHDHYSGRSHLVWWKRNKGLSSTIQFEQKLHLLWEPGAVFALAILLRLIFREQTLSLWFFVTAACLWSKEALNHWFGIRYTKRRRDSFADAEESIEVPAVNNSESGPPKPTRKAKVNRTRNTSASDTTEEGIFARILHLSSSFTLSEAEANFRSLMKDEHPDANGDSAESNARARELNAAIEYFRERH